MIDGTDQLLPGGGNVLIGYDGQSHEAFRVLFTHPGDVIVAYLGSLDTQFGFQKLGAGYVDAQNTHIDSGSVHILDLPADIIDGRTYGKGLKTVPVRNDVGVVFAYRLDPGGTPGEQLSVCFGKYVALAVDSNHSPAPFLRPAGKPVCRAGSRDVTSTLLASSTFSSKTSPRPGVSPITIQPSSIRLSTENP